MDNCHTIHVIIMDNCHTIHIITKALNCGHKHMIFIILGLIFMYSAVIIHVSTAVYLIPKALLVINGLNVIRIVFFLQVIYRDLTLEEKRLTDSYTDKFEPIGLY